jgi:hypothetical protein
MHQARLRLLGLSRYARSPVATASATSAGPPREDQAGCAEGHQRRPVAACPASLLRPQLGAPFRLHHIGVQTTFEGTTAQTGQDLIAQVAPAQVDVLRLQQQSPSEGSSASTRPELRDQAGPTRGLEPNIS